ncbi:unnamed protein product, partial [Linum tenue]
RTKNLERKEERKKLKRGNPAPAGCARVIKVSGSQLRSQNHLWRFVEAHGRLVGKLRPRPRRRRIQQNSKSMVP